MQSHSSYASSQSHKGVIGNFIEQPVQLISTNSFGKLVLHSNAVKYLRSLTSPISVLSIAGPYRTGKSFLLNSLLSSSVSPAVDKHFKSAENKRERIKQKRKFEVGHTINSTTHGLWIWGKPLLAENNQGKLTNVIVMDSEGYSSLNGIESHDKRIVTLAILLSSCFLYNSKGPIDKESIFDLEFVIEVARMIGKNYEGKSSNAEKQSPKDENQATKPCDNKKSQCDFHWVLRDFHLDLKNELGIAITEDQYMENCLLQASQHVNSQTIQTLKEYFPKRSCHCLVCPKLTFSADEDPTGREDTPNKNQCEQKQLEERPEFVQQIIELKKVLKGIKSFSMNGESFIELIQSYVNAMNDNEEVETILQEGYDCKVRIDCLEKLNKKLKDLEEEELHQKRILRQNRSNRSLENNQNRGSLNECEDQKQSDEDDEVQLDQRLLGIRTELKEFYNKRMCSHKQLEVLNQDVDEMLQGYQAERVTIFQQRESANGCHQRGMSNTHSAGMTSFKYVEKDPKKKLSIPKPENKNRLSINCSETEVKSVNETLNEDQNPSGLTKRNSMASTVQNKTDKQMLAKIEELEIKTHRLELELKTQEAENISLKSEFDNCKRNFEQKEDEVIGIMEEKAAITKQKTMEVQKAEEKLSAQEKQLRLVQSEMEKLSLLSNQKIDYLEKKLSEFDSEKTKQLQSLKAKYKQRIADLSEELEMEKQKREEQVLQIKQIYMAREEQKKKTLLLQGLKDEGEEFNLFQQLKNKTKSIEDLNTQIEELRVTNSNLSENLTNLQFKCESKEKFIKQSSEQQSKRYKEIEVHLKSIYESKLLIKDDHISELNAKIQSLNEIITTENKKLMKKLEQAQVEYSEEKQDLFNMNTELRNGCLQSLQRVGQLREELEQKQRWIEELRLEKENLKRQLEEQRQHQIENLNEVKNREQHLKTELGCCKEQLQVLRVNAENQSVFRQQQKLGVAKEVSALKSEIKANKQAIAERQSSLQLLQQQKQQLNSENYSLKNQVQELRNTLNETASAQIEQKRGFLEEVTKTKELLEQANKQKARLIESISDMNRKLAQNYEQFESLFLAKYDHNQEKYQKDIKDLRDKEKRRSQQTDSSAISIVRLEEEQKYLKKEVELLKAENSKLKEQTVVKSHELDRRQIEFGEKQRNFAKDLALAAQKLSFNEGLLKQQEQRFQDEKKRQEISVQILQEKLGSVQSLLTVSKNQKKQLESQLMSQKLKSQEKSLSFSQQLEKLQKLITLYQNDQKIMCQNMISLEKKASEDQIKSQNHIKLFTSKFNKLKSENQILEVKYHEARNLIEELSALNEAVNRNYLKDFAALKQGNLNSNRQNSFQIPQK